MAEEGLRVVSLEDNYYRDSFGKVIFIIICIFLSLLFLAGISLYIFMNQPPPTTFRVAEEWRVVAPVPVQQPYLSEPDMLQWVSEVVPRLFDVDFVNFDEQVSDAKKYFTDNGYKIFLNQLKNYAEDKTIEAGKLFARGAPTRAPIILNQGVLSGRYAWWVQIPLNISYAGAVEKPDVGLTLQALVVRTDTTNNLTGILIDNVIVEKDQAQTLTGIGGK